MSVWSSLTKEAQPWRSTYVLVFVFFFAFSSVTYMLLLCGSKVRLKCTHYYCLGYSKPIGLCVESPTDQVEIGIMLFCCTPGGHFAYDIVLTTVAPNDIHANNKHATSNHD